MISKEMIIGDVLDKYPTTAQIFTNFGMHCLHCPCSRGESIEDACKVHEIDVDALIDELNSEVDLRSDD